MEAVVAALAASLVSFAVLYITLDRRIRKRVDPETILAEIRREIEGLIVEMNQTADRSLTLMEERMSSVKSVLEEAEKRVAVLKREARALEQSQRVYATLRDSGADLDPVEPREKGRAVSTPRSARSARKAGTSRPRAPREPAPQPVDAAPDAAAVRARIVSLHRAGISAESIVRSLGVPRATVDLVVDLDTGSLGGGRTGP